MADTQRPGAVHWIDHYVVASTDLERWTDFQAKVVGSRPFEDRPPRFIAFQRITPCCHHGAMLSKEPLPPTGGLGKGLPRHALFVRQADVDQHVRRLDELNVPHLDPVRTSADGAEGISIAYEDPDGNQFEFWAPDHLPDGAMDNCTSVGVGRISHAVYESRDLQRAADHFDAYCAVEPLSSADSDTDKDTIVLPLLNGARIVYKQRASIGQRTGGWGKLSATHAALAVLDEDFWPNYERMWDGVPEWEYDRAANSFVGAGPDLPARTARHGSPAGQRWYEVRNRGDDWYDFDTNCFHFIGARPNGASFASYEAHSMEWQLPRWLEANGVKA